MTTNEIQNLLAELVRNRGEGGLLHIYEIRRDSPKIVILDPKNTNMNTSWENVIRKRYLISTLARKTYVWLLLHNIGQFVFIDTSLKHIIPRI